MNKQQPKRKSNRDTAKHILKDDSDFALCGYLPFECHIPLSKYDPNIHIVSCLYCHRAVAHLIEENRQRRMNKLRNESKVNMDNHPLIQMMRLKRLESIQQIQRLIEARRTQMIRERKWRSVNISLTDADKQNMEKLKSAYGIDTASGVIREALNRAVADVECGGVGAAAVAQEQARRNLAELEK